MKNFQLLALTVACVRSELVVPGFSNKFYPSYGYTGSRILETNYSSNQYTDAVWTQIASLNPSGGIYVADTHRHSVIYVNATKKYRAFPSEGSLYAGHSGLSGHRDGSLSSSMFNGPKGVAYFEKDGQRYLYVADTGNHCIRRIDIDSGRITTVAGIPGVAGHRDGDGRKALFNGPSSIGVDAAGLVFVLDNRKAVRKITMNDEFSDGVVQVESLVGGACRSVDTTTYYETVVVRTVRCQTGWTASSAGSSDAVESWTWPDVCLGNSVTCSTRYDEL